MSRDYFVSHDKAQEFDITRFFSEGTGKSGLLCISETTWELAYNLILFYGEWRSRYYFTDPDGIQLTITDEEYETVVDTVQLALRELQMSGCDELVQAINDIGERMDLSNQKLAEIGQALTEIKLAIEAVSVPDLTAEVDDLEEILDGIGTVLGAVAVLG